MQRIINGLIGTIVGFFIGVIGFMLLVAGIEQLYEWLLLGIVLTSAGVIALAAAIFGTYVMWAEDEPEPSTRRTTYYDKEGKIVGYSD